MSSGEVHMQVEGSVARIWFDRPEAMNSMTWKMYNDFEKISLRLQTMSGLRAIVLRGVGGKAFVAGTDNINSLILIAVSMALSTKKKWTEYSMNSSRFRHLLWQ